MFKEEKRNSSDSIETVIGPSVKVEGDFSGQGDIVVEGIVLGSLKTKGHLQVGNEAKITADVEAGSANISGEISGNIIVTSDLDLATTAKIKGDITTGSLTVAKGAKLNGKVSMSSEPILAEKPKEKVEDK
ncbi:polymer-forming cytoskeletal protein [bacterium]|jgi:cytoskeletal protein CcmA (bactofilin family)|nr:polymer-forming cytoskeletal protein [bacterium]MBT4121917.1 polymer-forming cytoskeletal protein [bacterium]MBT4763656.1 polymer-forming cytoskeletal protein [bacterium]MBT5401028.1 polymer-forming cytoskeletal protein [bacterium]MBT5942348.1 polymer-forming cytoskeletal protein [bacterium]